MSNPISTQLYQLRKENKLAEAEQVFMNLESDDKNHPFVQEAWAWVVFSGIREAVKQKNSQSLVQWWQKAPVDRLVDSDNEVLHSQYWFLINRTLFLLSPGQIQPIQAVIIELLCKLPVDSITEDQSKFLLLGIKKHLEQLPLFNQSLARILADCLPLNAFEKEEFEGKKILSVWERSYNAFYKKLLKEDSADNIIELDIDLMNQLSEKVANQHPKPRFYHYYEGKWAIKQGNQKEGISHLLKLTSQMIDFWVFSTLAEEIKGQDVNSIQLRIALNEWAWAKVDEKKMTLKILEHLTEDYITQKEYDKASWSLHTFLEIRKENGWKISDKWKYYSMEDWFELSTSLQPNPKPIEISLLKGWLDSVSVPVTVLKGIVTGKNERFSFITKADGNSFRLKTKTLNQFDVIDVLALKSGELLPFYSQSDDSSSTLKKTVCGTIKQTKSGIGFIQNCLIRQDVISSLGEIHPSDTFEATAHISYNEKRKEIGWKVYRIKRILSSNHDKSTSTNTQQNRS